MRMSNFNMGKIALFLLILCTSIPTHAANGREGGNGGDAIVTPSGVHFLDLIRDTDTLIDQEGEGYVDGLHAVLAKQPGFQTATYFPPGFDDKSKAVIDEIIDDFKSLNFYLVDGPLPEVGDRGVVSLPWNVNGVIVRLGLQDAATHKVLVDRAIYKLLPNKDRLAFFMHESLIRVYLDDFENDPLLTTEKIAALVNASFGDEAMLSARSVSRYLCDANIMAVEKAYSGLSQVKGLMGEHASYPEKATMIARMDGSCSAIDITLNGSPTGSYTQDVVEPYSSLTYWTYSTMDDNGTEQVVFISFARLQSLASQTTVEVRGKTSFPLIFEAPYLTLSKAHFGLWNK